MGMPSARTTNGHICRVAAGVIMACLPAVLIGG